MTAHARVGIGGDGILDFWVLSTRLGRHQRDPRVILTTAVTVALVSMINDNTAGFDVSAKHSSPDFAAITV